MYVPVYIVIVTRILITSTLDLVRSSHLATWIYFSISETPQNNKISMLTQENTYNIYGIVFVDYILVKR